MLIRVRWRLHWPRWSPAPPSDFDTAWHRPAPYWRRLLHRLTR